MRTRPVRALGALVALPLVITACGGDSKTAKPNDDGVVEITMRDQRYEPDHIEVEAGQPITFRFKNEGALVHEAFVGTIDEQQAHEQEMTANGGNMDMSSTSTTSGMGHDMSSTGEGMSDDSMPSSSTTPNTTGSHDASEPVVQVDPGKTSDLAYMAAKSGTLLIGCHQPGHWQAGMRATLKVG